MIIFFEIKLGYSKHVPSAFQLIGNNSPVKLLDYINALEEFFEIEADKEFLPIQPGDVPDTFADVSDLIKNFAYKPSMPIKEGIKNFVQWYREFYDC